MISVIMVWEQCTGVCGVCLWEGYNSALIFNILTNVYACLLYICTGHKKVLAQTPVKQTTPSMKRMRTANVDTHTRDSTPLPSGCHAKLWKEAKRITDIHLGTSCR